MSIKRKNNEEYIIDSTAEQSLAAALTKFPLLRWGVVRGMNLYDYYYPEATTHHRYKQGGSKIQRFINVQSNPIFQSYGGPFSLICMPTKASNCHYWLCNTFSNYCKLARRWIGRSTWTGCDLRLSLDNFAVGHFFSLANSTTLAVVADAMKGAIFFKNAP